MKYKLQGILEVNEPDEDINIKIMDAIEKAVGGMVKILLLWKFKEDE